MACFANDLCSCGSAARIAASLPSLATLKVIIANVTLLRRRRKVSNSWGKYRTDPEIPFWGEVERRRRRRGGFKEEAQRCSFPEIFSLN
jgi:hypothetical protein